MTELSRMQKDAIMKAIGLDGLDQESKDILLGLSLIHISEPTRP